MNAEQKIRRELEIQEITERLRLLEARDSSYCNYDWNGLVECTVGLKLDYEDETS